MKYFTCWSNRHHLRSDKQNLSLSWYLMHKSGCVLCGCLRVCNCKLPVLLGEAAAKMLVQPLEMESKPSIEGFRQHAQLQRAVWCYCSRRVAVAAEVPVGIR